MTDTEHRESAEQRLYARWLDAGTQIGFAILVGTFVLYVFGVLPAHVPLSDLPRYWGMPVDRYLAATATPSGWGWVALIGQGEFLSFVGIAFLALVTVACFVRVMLSYLAHGERLYAALAAAAVAVSLLAASGLASGGH